jgi:putative Mn2+ efflux pump MntP
MLVDIFIFVPSIKMTAAQIITFLLLGIGLSLDSFAVSVSCGIVKREIRFIQATVIAGFFAAFQAIFPVIGWLIGNLIKEYIAFFDHWIAFVLLAFIGIKMIIEGTRSDGEFTKFNPFKLNVLIALSVATSIDALAVGLSFGFLDLPIIYPVFIIGTVTFTVSMLGMLFGKNVPSRRILQSLILGGIILTVIGIKILVEHQFL